MNSLAASQPDTSALSVLADACVLSSYETARSDMTAESVVGDSFGVPDTSLPPAAREGPGASGGTADSGESASFGDHALPLGRPRSFLTAKPVKPGSKPFYVNQPAAGAVPGPRQVGGDKEAEVESLAQNNDDEQDAAQKAGNGKEAQTAEEAEQAEQAKKAHRLAQQKIDARDQKSAGREQFAEEEEPSESSEEEEAPASSKPVPTRHKSAGREQFAEGDEPSESSEEEEAPASSKPVPKRKAAGAKSVSQDKKKRKKDPWASKPSKTKWKLPLTQDQRFAKKLKDEMGAVNHKIWLATSARKIKDNQDGNGEALKYKTPKQLFETYKKLQEKHAQISLQAEQEHVQGEQERLDNEGQGQGSSNGAAKK